MKGIYKDLAIMAAAIGTEVAMRGDTPARVIGGSVALIGGYYGLEVGNINFKEKGLWNRDLGKLIATSLTVHLVWNAFARFVLSQLSASSVLGLAAIAAMKMHYDSKKPQNSILNLDNVVDLTMLVGGEISLLMQEKTIRSSADVVTMGTGLYGLAVTIILGTAVAYIDQTKRRSAPT